MNSSDRLFWVVLQRLWSGWKDVLVIVTDTVVGWRRAGFRWYWRWRSRRRGGRPRITEEVRRLIWRLAQENSAWGAPQIHGELRKLGFDVSERTVARYGDYLALDIYIFLPYTVLMMTLKQLMAAFPTEETCRTYIFEHRWPHGVTCPRCGNDKVYKLNRAGHWQCAKCSKSGYRFSLLTGTVFENTKYPLTTWFQVLWTMLNSKKGVSALQIQRQIGSGSYQTAWYLCHRLRAAMQDAEFCKLMGIVEVDETYIGGKDKNRHWDKKSHLRGGAGKTGVIGAISRKGNVVCKVIENTDADTLSGFVREAVSDKVELVATDEALGYDRLREMGYKHSTVNHSQHEYVRGNVSTASIDNFWSLLKRGIVGTYHNVSKEYLPLYLAEFQFRYNNRKNPDIFRDAIRGC